MVVHKQIKITLPECNDYVNSIPLRQFGSIHLNS